jgi:GH24 family phage-related lysozyme (muramidase)
MPIKSFKTFLIEQQDVVKCDVNNICTVIRGHESAGNEEKILGVYPDSKGFPTIGHGHLITKDSPTIIGQAIKDPKRVQRILAKQDRMTPEEAEALLRIDVESRLPTVKKLAPEFETYSPELQAELTSEYFRGMVGKSPAAMTLLRAGDFEGAATEFLNADDYRKSVQEKTGIAGRMKTLADAMRREGQLRKPPEETKPVEQPETPKTPVQNEYEVKPGDTLWKIGGGAPGVERIKQLNPGLDPNKIKPGQRIKIPN